LVTVTNMWLTWEIVYPDTFALGMDRQTKGKTGMQTDHTLKMVIVDFSKHTFIVPYNLIDLADLQEKAFGSGWSKMLWQFTHIGNRTNLTIMKAIKTACWFTNQVDGMTLGVMNHTITYMRRQNLSKYMAWVFAALQFVFITECPLQINSRRKIISPHLRTRQSSWCKLLESTYVYTYMYTQTISFEQVKNLTLIN